MSTKDVVEEMRKKAHDALLATLGKIQTWDEFYGAMTGKFEQFKECGCFGHLYEATLTYYAFIIALRDLPEEGDIKVIIAHMIDTLINKCEERLGLKAEYGEIDPNEQGRMALAFLLGRGMAAQREHMEPPSIEVPAAEPGKKPTLQ